MQRFPMPPSLGDVEGMIERKAALGIELTIIGSPVGAGAMVPGCGIDNSAQSASELAALHDWMAQLVADHPRNLRAYVYTNPFGGGRLLSAAADTLRGSGFVGFIVNTSVRGEYIGGPRGHDFFAMAAELDVPVLLHPPAEPVGASSLGNPGLVEQLARFSDVTAGLASCILDGLLDRHPNLKLIAATAGGAIALLGEKLDRAHRSRPWAPGADRPTPGPVQLAHPPSSYLRRVLVDTATPSRLALLADLEAVGAENMLFGTDAPPLMEDLESTLGTVIGLPLTPGQRDGILASNAERLFRFGDTADQTPSRTRASEE
jgi:aminocarboxymuconate-semialdehyde decarboxylase